MILNMLFFYFLWGLTLSNTLTNAKPLDPSGWVKWPSETNANRLDTSISVSKSSTRLTAPSSYTTSNISKSNITTSYFNTTSQTARPTRPYTSHETNGLWADAEEQIPETTETTSSDAIYGWQNNTEYEKPTEDVPPAITTMTPSIPPGHDADDHQHLQPAVDQGLFFAEGSPNSYAPLGSLFLSANTKFNYPSVVLDYTNHASATVSGTSISVQFTTQEAYNIAVSSWPQDGSTFILVTNVGSDDGHFVYYLVSGNQFDLQTLTCAGVFTTPELNNLAQSFDLSWGQLSPQSDSDSDYADEYDPTLMSNDFQLNTTEVAFFKQTVSESSDGYHLWDQEHFKDDIHDFAPGIADDDWSHYQTVSEDDDGIYGADGEIDVSPLGKLQERNAGRGTPATPVSNVRKTAASQTKTQAPRRPSIFARLWGVVKKVVNVVKKVVSFVDGTPQVFQKSSHWEVPKQNLPRLNMKKSQHDSQYWTNPSTKQRRKQFLLTETQPKSKNGKFEVYCVDCGIKAEVVVTGTAAFHILKGLTQAQIGLTAYFYAGLHVGVVAEYALEEKKSVTLLTVPIAGIHVPKIITIGPVVTVGATASAKMNAKGRLLVGGSVELKGIKAVLDLRDSAKNIAPVIKPVFTPVFEAQGEIQASLALTLPVTIAVAIDIAGGTIHASGGVTAEPGLRADAKYSFNSKLENGVVKTQSGNAQCQGVSTSLWFQNEFYAQAKAKFFGAQTETNRLRLGNLYEHQLAGTCIGPKSPNTRKRQYDNDTSTLTDDTDESFETTWDAIALEAYAPDSPDLPFPPILTGFYVDDDNDGINDIYESTWLSDLQNFYPDVGDYDPWNYTSQTNLTDPQDVPVTVDKRQAANRNDLNPAYNYTIMTDSTFSMNLVWEKEGFIGVQTTVDEMLGNPNAMWQQFNDVVVGDSSGRTMYFWPSLMQRSGWSPFLLAAPDKIPQHTQIVNLINMVFDSSTPLGPQNSLVTNVPAAIYVASDSRQNAYWPVVCNYINSKLPSRVFLLADPAVQKLVKESRSSVFNSNAKISHAFYGGQIDNCQALPLINGDKGTSFQ